MNSTTTRILLAALAALAFARVTVFGLAFPVFTNVDERAHVDLVAKYAARGLPGPSDDRFEPATIETIAQDASPEYFENPANRGKRELRLANRDLPAQERERWLAATREHWSAQSNYEIDSAPLYYAVAAGWLTVGRALGASGAAEVHWLRALGALFAAASVCAAWKLARELFWDRVDVAWAAAALVACFPQDAWFSTGCDSLSPLVFALALLAATRWSALERRGLAASAAVGVALALPYLTRTSNLATWVLLAATAWSSWRRARGPTVALCAGALVAIGAWTLYAGAVLGDPLGTARKLEHFGWTRKPIERVFEHPIFALDGLWIFARDLARTGWRGEVVWFSAQLHSDLADVVYVLASGLLVVGALVATRDRAAATREAARVVVVALALTVAALFVLSIAYDFSQSPYPSVEYPYAASGRLLGALVVPLIVVGLGGLARAVAARPLAVGTLVVAAVALVSEIAVSLDVFASPANGFRVPWW